MSKLHELLAVEKTLVAAWNKLFEETIHKLKSPSEYLTGYSKSLQMIEESPANQALQTQAEEHKPVTTTVADTLEYAFGIFARAEDLQYQKNATNRQAVGTVMWRGAELLKDMPVDELLGLEARLTKIKQMFETMPTLAGSKIWKPALGDRKHVFQSDPEHTTKTEKVMTPVIMAPATDKHPAQVQAVTKDNVVGTFTTVHRSGAATTNQKAYALKMMDELISEVKQARMRANQTEAVTEKIGSKLVELLMSPFNQE